MNKLTGIGLGTFPFAGVFGGIDEGVASSILKKYIDFNGKLIQVSVVYNAGKVEEFLGKEFKKYNRSDFSIMSCCGWKPQDGKYVKSGKREDVLKACDDSLLRLGLDYIDVFMSHSPDTTTPYKETIDAMKELKAKGKIKEICVSNVTLEQLKEYNYDGAVNYIQNRYSLINRNMNQSFFDYCINNDIKITT